MNEDLKRKNIQVNLQVYDTLTSLKHGNATYSDVLIDLLNKAGVKLVETK